MKTRLFITLCLLATCLSHAQDERFFRKLFSGDMLKSNKVEDVKRYSYLINGPEYFLDLNNDGVNESLVYLKRDSEDWLDVYNSYREKIFSYRFETKGAHSGLYKIAKRELSDTTTLILLFYFEGDTNYIKFESSARIYLMTIDNKDLKKINIFKGPSIFEEYKGMRGDYHLRNYEFGVKDFASLGSKQFYIKYRGISKIYLYNGNGKWKNYLN